MKNKNESKRIKNGVSFGYGKTNYVAIRDVKKFKEICKDFHIKTKRKKSNKYKMIVQGEFSNLWRSVDYIAELTGKEKYSNENYVTAFDFISDTIEKGEKISFVCVESVRDFGLLTTSITIDYKGDKTENAIYFNDEEPIPDKYLIN